MSKPSEKQIAGVVPISVCTSNCDTPADEIENLAEMGVEALRAAWKTRFRTVAPPIRSTDTLRRLFAWRIQAQAFGDLDPETAKLLFNASNLLRRGKSPVPHSGHSLRAGAVLVREWRGIMHRVLVLDTGFEHVGKRYRTLTEVAYAITGTRWSGPRFFGLVQKQEGPANEPATLA
jgi:hypothetical protein